MGYRFILRGELLLTYCAGDYKTQIVRDCLWTSGPDGASYQVTFWKALVLFCITEMREECLCWLGGAILTSSFFFLYTKYPYSVRHAWDPMFDATYFTLLKGIWQRLSKFTSYEPVKTRALAVMSCESSSRTHLLYKWQLSAWIHSLLSEAPNGTTLNCE